MVSAGFLKWKKLGRERLALEKKMMSLGEMVEGSLLERRIRCGSRTCRCAEGELHGPYFYLSRKVRGETKMIYLKDKRMIVAARNYREFQKVLTRWRGVLRGMGKLLGEFRDRRIIRTGK